MYLTLEKMTEWNMTQFKNLSIVGPHNLDKISVLEGAFESADAFCDEFLKSS